MNVKTNQQGLTLIELMIAISLGLVVVLGITGLVLSSKTAQLTQNDAANMQDTVRFAMDNISRSIKQAGYINFDQEDAPFIRAENMPASIIGFDAGSLNARGYGGDFSIKKSGRSNNFSDILTLRYFGSGIPSDYTVLNCAGFGVSAPTSPHEVEKERGWSIYYVANDVDNEPALFCKYHGESAFSSQAIARGVESFQVLYGIPNTAHHNSHATEFLSANEIAALDANIPNVELNHKTHWKKISSIKIAMLIRSTEDVSLDASATPSTTYNLFGEEYSNRRGAIDKGTQIKMADIAPEVRRRVRKMVSTTVQLRNPLN